MNTLRLRILRGGRWCWRSPWRGCPPELHATLTHGRSSSSAAKAEKKIRNLMSDLKVRPLIAGEIHSDWVGATGSGQAGRESFVGPSLPMLLPSCLRVNRTGILCRIQERSFTPPPRRIQDRHPSSCARKGPSSRCSSGQECFVGFLVNHNRPPLPAFFISVDFKGTLSCFRINTSRSVDSKGGYGRYYQTLCTSVDSRWLGTWGGTGCGGD
jgi:hypothetical protein